ncbi:MAG: response regulator transcription factor [Ferruginibacter sp.]
MIRILIADDHSVVRKGLKQILLEGFPTAHIEEVPDAEEMIRKIMQSPFDVVISDLSMPGRSGLEALQQIKQINSKLPVLILSIHPEDQYALRVLKAGASGYLSKDMAPDELVNAVQRVMLGKKYITASIAEKLASVLDQDSGKAAHENLSDREFSVLKLLAAGKSVSEIAESLFLSVTTVSTYRSRIMAKMGMKNNADLTLYSIEHKLI